MDIRGKTKVFRKKHESRSGTWYSYFTSVGNKTDKGWDNDPYEIVLAKGAKNEVIEDGAIINITDGFLSCRSYIDKGGEKKIVSQYVVMAFEGGYAPAEEPTEEDFAQEDIGGYSALIPDDIPF